MDKMKMESVDMTAQNIEKIGAMFPNCITETVDENGKPKKAINFELLKQMLSDEVLEGDEAYEFTWVGKKAAIVEANKPIRKTLRPCVGKSVNWETTENLYIEGDNSEVLKLLQESYLEAVKLIYIDPPYNTGKDSFVYPDNYTMNRDEYEAAIGLFDEAGNKIFKENNGSNPRFHSDWCSMMYSRLLLARNLLSKDGVIFISLDDTETTNMTKICDEVFGESNRIALICHKARASVSNDKIISPNHNTVLFYAKNIDAVFMKRKEIGLDPDLDGFNYDDNDGYGSYRLVPVDGPGGAKKGNPYYEFMGVEGYFRFSKDTMQDKYNHGLVVKRGNSLYQKYYRSSAVETRKTATTWWDGAGLTSNATTKLRELMGGAYFSNPKPMELLMRIVKMMTYSEKDALILDFFSGSATTANAVIQMNAEDGGHRKYIMVQLPEIIGEQDEAYSAGYRNICDIGQERIRRAGKEIKNATNADIDYGFRVLMVDDTNMTDVYYSVDEYNQSMLSMLESNVKPDRTDLDLLFGCLLEWGLPLSLPYTSEQIEGCTVHTYNDGDLIACFDENVPDSVVKAIAKRQPLRAVFRDSSFASSPAKINITEIFKLLAPDTRVKVI